MQELSPSNTVVPMFPDLSSNLDNERVTPFLYLCWTCLHCLDPSATKMGVSWLCKRKQSQHRKDSCPNLANTQAIRIWWIVSSAWSHKRQTAGQGSPHLARQSARHSSLIARGEGGQDFQIHSCKYSNKTSIGKAPLILATQLLFCKACTIIRCFKALLGMTLIRLGACTAIVLPKSQRSSQNLVEVPLPTVFCTAIPWNVWVIHGTCSGKPAQRRSSSSE